MTQKDRPKLPLLVLAAGGILLGAAALQSVLITVPGPGSSNPHAITVDTKPPAATPKPWDEPSPTVELAPAEPADPSPTGTVPDKPQNADHAVDPAAPPSPAEATATPTEPAKPVADEPKVETPPAELKPAPKPEPSQIAKSEPEIAARAGIVRGAHRGRAEGGNAYRRAEAHASAGACTNRQGA